MAWKLPGVCLALAVGVASMGMANAKFEFMLDIGGPMDGPFIGTGWHGTEGPAPQWGRVWDSTCRWTSQGATVTIPVSPGVVNHLEMRAAMGEGDGQELRLFLDGRKISSLRFEKSLIYKAEIPTDALGKEGWAELRLETEIPAPRSEGDSRDLRVAVDWIRVSADAPARDILREALAKLCGAGGRCSRNKAPTHWRMRYDPNNVGDTYSIQRFDQLMYDDSAFDTVETSFTPKMRPGDACWYRAWVVIDDGLDGVRKGLRLPGDRVAKDGHRSVSVNGMEVKAGSQRDLAHATAAMLGYGASLIVVKVMKGPFAEPGGDPIIERPKLTQRIENGKTRIFTGTLVLTPGSSANRLRVRLMNPNGKEVGSAGFVAQDLGDGKRGSDPEAAWTLAVYGQHDLMVEDDAGHIQHFPVHHLGINLFHWGWYSAGGGTGWHGFKPCSNDYLDQLFSRLDDWGMPHHSVTWGGAILEPGSGFHRTEKVDYTARFRDAIACGKLDFVGAPFPPRNICTDFGESLLRSMRRSIKQYEGQLKTRPHTFVSHDSTMTPLLPQIMRLCGYDTYCIAENWWGQGRSIPNSRDCYWRNPEGTAIRMLDSWYHGISPVAAARRAVQQGKPAVLCNEEFACLDATVFLNQADLDTLAAEGIFLTPVSLEEYERITRDFAKEYTYQGDRALCYKGWTGGGEGEVEFEKANRMLEARLVAVDNLATFARYLGIVVDDKEIDKWWNNSFRYHECHCHWGNAWPEGIETLRDGAAWAEGEISRLAGLIAPKIKDEGIAVFNPIGLRRDGLVKVDAPAGTKALVDPRGRESPVQPDPDNGKLFLAAVPDLPSLGYRVYRPASATRQSPTMAATLSGGMAILSNGLVTVALSSDGAFSITDTAGKPLFDGGNRLYFARAQGKAPGAPLSTEGNPLNLECYQAAAGAGAPRIVCQGPVMAAAECDLRLTDYPGASIVVRVSLVDRERKARVRLTMAFKERTVVFPRSGITPSEGTYFPGIFVAFPFPAGAKPLADMAYCTTDGVLTSTNHETFMKEPFRNGTFNTLSLAGPNSGEYSVLTRGLPDFFVIPRPSVYMGMSLGVGHESTAYHDTYIHEYAVYVPEPAQQKRTRILAYREAQGFLVEPVAVPAGGSGDLAAEASLAEASGPSVIVPGVQLEHGELRMRVLNLDTRNASSTIRGLLNLDRAEVCPQGRFSSGRIELGPQAVREISLRLKP